MNEIKYRVEHLQDNTYCVIEMTDDILAKYRGEAYIIEREVVFQGSLSDCEAYIRLKEKNQID